jgi:3-hydroxymyristoyl/3-hydroxydecanoyl-(acyl carrier protein) dehydratase
MWHALCNMGRTALGETTAEVQVPPESHWFAGHFPGEPILPGIAQLGIVYDAVCRTRADRPGIAGFSRVKFKKIIRPRDCLKVSIVPKKNHEGVYAFRIFAGDEIACSGTLALRKSDDLVEPGPVVK